MHPAVLLLFYSCTIHLQIISGFQIITFYKIELYNQMKAILTKLPRSITFLHRKAYYLKYNDATLYEENSQVLTCR